MRTRHKSDRAERSVFIGIAIGTLAAMLALLAGAAVMTTLQLNETIGTDSAAMASMAVTFLAAFIGAFTAIKVAGGEKRLLLGGSTAAVLVLVIVGTNMLLLDGSLPGFWGGSVAVLLGAALSFLLTGQRKTRSAMHRKMRSR